VKAEQPRLKVHKPEVSFDAEFTNTADKVENGKSYTAPIKYVRLDAEPSATELKGAVVLLDTYGELEERLVKVQKAGAVAVILALHTENTKAEGLNVKDDNDEKDTESKTTGDADVIAQAQRLAQTARQQQAANDAEAQMIMMGGRPGASRTRAARPAADATEEKAAAGAPVRLSAAAKKRRARVRAKEKGGQGMYRRSFCSSPLLH
jgi:hypothetical protein